MSKVQRGAIAPRDDSDSEETASIVDENESMNHASSEGDNAASQTEDEDSRSNSSEDEVNDDLKDITFGALAEAHLKIVQPSRKRKLTDRNEKESEDEEAPKRPREDRKDIDYSTRPKEKRISRSSKHAPTAMSSRNPVSRKRAIFSPPASEKFRDPRFDATILADSRRGNTSSTQRAQKNYAFLSEYQAKEILDLKTQLKKTKDPEVQAELKREVMSLEAKLRNAETTRRETEIRQEHQQGERQAIKEGRKSKPYFLKDSDVKKQILQERQDAMGKRAKDKSDKRKKKREKTKDARDMPRVRRYVDG